MTTLSCCSVFGPAVLQLIEMGVFEELNQFGPDDTPTPDLIELDPSAPKPRNGLLSRMKSRFLD